MNSSAEPRLRGQILDQRDEPATRIHYILAVARALISSNSPISPPQVYDWLEANGLRRGRNTLIRGDLDQDFHKEVRFARQELADGGLVRSIDGRWAVAHMDDLLGLTPDLARDMISRNRRARESRRASGEQADPQSTLRPSDPSPTTGPRPLEWTSVTRRRDGRASTYAFRFGETDLWKIGFSSQVDVRLREVNRHIPTELGGGGWTLYLSARWSSQLAAYSMEQEVLYRLTGERTMFERARCSPERLRATWDSARAVITAQQRR